MTPRAAAVIGLRLLACWILLQAVFGVGTLVYVMCSGHSPTSVINPIIAPSFDRSHDASVSHALLWSTLPWIIIRFVAGFILLLLSKPIGRLVARGVEGDERMRDEG